MGFTLEMTTPEKLTAERERQRKRQEIARRMAEPIKGCGEIHAQPQLDVGQTGQMDLFNPIVENSGKEHDMKNAWGNFMCRVHYCGPAFGWAVYRGMAQMKSGLTKNAAENLCRRLNNERSAQ